jgi:PleD family two-component response regulator
MSIGDKKALDDYRNQLLRRAEAIQRHLDEVTRAAREELVSIRDQIRALDSPKKAPEKNGKHRANILDRKSVTVPKTVKTVLIVEKRPSYTQSLVNQIRSAGLNPVIAVTAEGGLRKAEECRPDLILLEIELPDRDGLKFVSEIRRHSEADRIPIIAMSALPHLKSRCLEPGCNEFLLKPVRMIDLIARIKKFLRSDPSLPFYQSRDIRPASPILHAAPEYRGFLPT